MIPAAKSITIARVASRVSISRAYQQQVLQALKRYFDGTKRLVKRGDLLALQVDANEVHSRTSQTFGSGRSDPENAIYVESALDKFM